jgi:lysophospholipase
MTELLLDTPENPVPASASSASAGIFITADNKRIRYALFRNEVLPTRGTVVLIHGRNEFIEKYFETIGDLLQAGLDVATYDLRGQGLSDRLLRNRAYGHVRRFDDHVDDLKQFLNDVILPDCVGPFYLLAHSTGGLIALLAAPDLTNQIVRMVLSAPLLKLYGQPFKTRNLRRFTGFLRAVGAGSFPIRGGNRRKGADAFVDNVLTSDPKRYARNIAITETHPDLRLGPPTAGWLHAASAAMEKVQSADFAARIHIPALFIAAGADRVVSTPVIEAYSQRLRSGALLVVDGARHELLQEADRYREQFLAAFKAFIPDEEVELAASQSSPEDR